MGRSGKKILKPGIVPQQLDWNAIFEQINVMAWEKVGESAWTTYVVAAKRELDNLGVIVSGPKMLAILTLGLYLGLTYSKVEKKQE